MEIVNEEIILSVGGHGPEAAFQRGRKGFKMDRIRLFSGQRCAGFIHRCLGIDRHVHGVGAKPHQRYHRAVGVLRAEVADGLAVIDPLTEFSASYFAPSAASVVREAPEAICVQRLGSSFAQEAASKVLPAPTLIAESFFSNSSSASAGGLTCIRAFAVLKNSAGVMESTLFTGTKSFSSL